jgi:glycerol-3-phosphate acyltransferase PlsY
MSEAAVLLGAYLLGSIPFSWLVARRFGVEDVRRVGSGNVGATNVMRSAGKTAGALAFLLDFLKGAVAALLAARLSAVPWLPAASAAAAVLGHVHPVWLRFRGGKGVATGAGAMLPLAPLATALALVVFPLVLVATRYVSVASIAGTVSLAALSWVLDYPPPTSVAASVVGALVVWKHRGNLARLARGTENRMGQRGGATEGGP